MIYGLLDECLQKYGNLLGQRVWLFIVNAYNHMPFAAVVADKILALHGGLSPHLKQLNDINKVGLLKNLTLLLAHKFCRFRVQLSFLCTALRAILSGPIRVSYTMDGR